MTLSEKTAKFVLLFAVIGLALWALLAGEAPHQQAAPGGFRDTELYRAASEQSGGYYERVIDLHRAHGYPLKPFYTVRLPTLATLTAAVGPDTMGMLLWFLLAAGVVAWLYRLREAHFLERLAAVFLFGLFATPLSTSIYSHDVWAGMLLAVGLGWGRATFGFLAAIVRELTFPFLLAGIAASYFAKQRASALLVAAAVAATAIFIHALIVSSLTTAADPPSAGWLGLRGAAGFVSDVRLLTAFRYLPYPIACLFAFLPLLGWYQMRDWHGLLWFAGFAAVLMIFCRPDTYYWAANIIPAYFIGLAFVPRFIRSSFSGRDGGQGGIRTHGELAPTAVFKTAALNHSATCPRRPATAVEGHCHP